MRVADLTPAKIKELSTIDAMRLLTIMNGPDCGDEECWHCTAVRLLRRRIHGDEP